jgi:hypothetical protein
MKHETTMKHPIISPNYWYSSGFSSEDFHVLSTQLSWWIFPMFGLVQPKSLVQELEILHLEYTG